MLLPRQIAQIRQAEEEEYHNSLIGLPTDLEVKCRTCKDERVLHLADSVTAFITQHEDHETYMEIISSEFQKDTRR